MSCILVDGWFSIVRKETASKKITSMHRPNDVSLLSPAIVKRVRPTRRVLHSVLKIKYIYRFASCEESEEMKRFVSVSLLVHP
jgi:hypothetical protein